jgi:polysaccharide deacetylase family protein (PEP-CTERM system associated)
VTEAAPRPRILLTVEVEDYFQVGRFEQLVPRERWGRFETRLDRNTRRALDLLDRFGIRATFFTLGWVADHLPELVREIGRRGHEVASLGYAHRTVHDRQLDIGEFREDVARARDAVEYASGREVVGNRVPHYLGPGDLWALDVLLGQGFAYDSSLRPIGRGFAAEPWRRLAHQHGPGPRRLWEFPLSSWSLFGFSLPIAGAGYFRHLPHGLLRQAVRAWPLRHAEPFVMYFRVWELDPEQPRIEAASRLAKLRHYRNLDKMERVLSDYFREFPACGIADYLGRSPALPAADAPSREPACVAAASARVEPGAAQRLPVSVVVPCHNEADSLGYLANTLRSVEEALGQRYAFQFLFVDDGSTDGTWDALERLFGGRTNCRLLRHDANRGVAAAILTGLRAAPSEVVCSIDCDCTYDPHQLAQLIPLLAPGVDLVTASPYHPRGVVRNVPRWRLALSRGASFLYRRVLGDGLATHTSCFRVYRRDALASLELEEGGFLGVAEMLGRLELRGARVVEHPATLEVRVLGRSKMKVLAAILGHLRLLARLARLRLSGRRAARAAAQPAGAFQPGLGRGGR